MSKTVETIVEEEKYEHPEGRWADWKVTYEVTVEPGQFCPTVVSIKLIEMVDDGVIEEDLPRYRRSHFEENKAVTIAKQRGIKAKHLDLDPYFID